MGKPTAMTGAKRRTDRVPSGVLLATTALGLPLFLAACGHSDPVDTPVNWWHQLEGGAIAEQRPPPPGIDDPYPKIGTTPAAAPPVASVALRKSVTEDLVEQRNLSARLNAHEPLPPPATMSAEAKKSGQPPAPGAVANPNQSSATLDAADAPQDTAKDGAKAPASIPGSAPASAGAVKTARPADPAPDADEPPLAIPAIVQMGANTGAAAGPASPLPPIPNAPPPPPELPGLATPPAVVYAPPPRPHYVLAPASGDILQFVAGSDALAPGQGGTLSAIASRRRGGVVFVHGFGEATSDSPHDQAQALTLAALRAQTVADALQKAGVPGSAIRLRTAAFGRGATAGLID